MNVLPKVAVVIPTTDNVELLSACVKSIIENCYYPKDRITFFVAYTKKSHEVTNGEKVLVENYIPYVRTTGFDFRWVEYRNTVFNYAKVNNYVFNEVADKDTEVAIFMNNDVELLNDCISDMVSLYVKHKDVIGTIGARLLYQFENKIQHDGIEMWSAGGMMPSFGHKNIGVVLSNTNPREADSEGVYHSNYSHIGNTFALALTPMKVFREIGGLNEEYERCFEDVEYNIRCLALGLLNPTIWSTIALHKESATRNKDVIHTDWERVANLYDRYAYGIAKAVTNRLANVSSPLRVAVQTTMSNLDYANDFVAHYVKLGFDRVVLCVSNAAMEQFDKSLDVYIKSGVVVLEGMDIADARFDTEKYEADNQLKAYSKYRGMYDYILTVSELDYLKLPKENTNVKEWLANPKFADADVIRIPSINTFTSNGTETEHKWSDKVLCVNPNNTKKHNEDEVKKGFKVEPIAPYYRCHSFYRTCNIDELVIDNELADGERFMFSSVIKGLHDGKSVMVIDSDAMPVQVQAMTNVHLGKIAEYVVCFLRNTTFTSAYLENREFLNSLEEYYNEVSEKSKSVDKPSDYVVDKLNRFIILNGVTEEQKPILEKYAKSA